MYYYITILRIESTVDIHKKNAVSKNVSNKSPYERKRSAELVEEWKSLLGLKFRFCQLTP